MDRPPDATRIGPVTIRCARPGAATLAAALLAFLPLSVAAPQVPPSPPEPGTAPFKVVLDPGHGGAEDGAIGPAGLKEKDLVLDMARRLASLLRAEGFEVVLTREGDSGPSLDERAEVANIQRADVFLSLHANASRSSKARGAETYFLARDATDDAARTVAAIENDASGSGLPGVGGDDGALPLILWDMAQTIFLEQSAELAEIVQQQLNSALGITDRGVRQAPFRVLVGATMPAVLVELGFLTNPEEERRLGSDEYRRKLAQALAAALVRYRAQYGSRGAAPGTAR